MCTSHFGYCFVNLGLLLMQSLFLFILTATNTVQSFRANASNGSVSYCCTFLWNAPVEKCYIEIVNIVTGETTSSQAMNDANDSVAHNTTEEQCNGKYTVVCYYVVDNSTNKNLCAVKNVTVSVTDSSRICSSKTVPMTTYIPSTSYTPTPSSTSSPNCKSICSEHRY